MRAQSTPGWLLEKILEKVRMGNAPREKDVDLFLFGKQSFSRRPAQTAATAFPISSRVAYTFTVILSALSSLTGGWLSSLCLLTF